MGCMRVPSVQEGFRLLEFHGVISLHSNLRCLQEKDRIFATLHTRDKRKVNMYKEATSDETGCH
jgi:hypothetical protein